MAVKITLDGSVKLINPEDEQFSLDELNGQVEGWIEPTKIGPIWVMHAENAKGKEPLNQVASFFFDVALHGTVLVVPPMQMPSEWDLLEEGETAWTSEQIDMGFLTALQTTLVMHRMLNEGPVNLKNPYKEEWSYQPSDNIDESVKEFFRKAYDSIVSQKGEPREHVIFEDDSTVVKTKNKTDHLKTIDQMIEYFIEVEEYEKCAALQRVKKAVEEEP
jgi:hypothetical protein